MDGCRARRPLRAHRARPRTGSYFTEKLFRVTGTLPLLLIVRVLMNPSLPVPA